MLEIHPSLLLYQVGIFAIFLLLMWKYVYKGLVGIVEERRRYIERTILEAEQKRGEADALRMGYEGRVAELNRQAEEIIRQAEVEAHRLKEAIIDQGRAEATSILERSRAQCEADIAEAMRQAKTELLEIAGQLATTALGKAVTPELQDRLVQELSEELRRGDWRRN